MASLGHLYAGTYGPSLKKGPLACLLRGSRSAARCPRLRNACSRRTSRRVSATSSELAELLYDLHGDMPQLHTQDSVIPHALIVKQMTSLSAAQWSWLRSLCSRHTSSCMFASSLELAEVLYDLYMIMSCSVLEHSVLPKHVFSTDQGQYSCNESSVANL